MNNVSLHRHYKCNQLLLRNGWNLFLEMNGIMG